MSFNIKIERILDAKASSTKYWYSAFDEVFFGELRNNPERANEALKMSETLLIVYGDVMDDENMSLYHRMQNFYYSNHETAIQYIEAEIDQLIEFYEKDKFDKEPIFREIAESHNKRAKELSVQLELLNLRKG